MLIVYENLLSNSFILCTSTFHSTYEKGMILCLIRDDIIHESKAVKFNDSWINKEKKMIKINN